MKRSMIAQAARRAGVGMQTARFYVRQGLLSEPAGDSTDSRQGEDRLVRRLLLIRRGKELGFTLNEIKDLLSTKTG
jgi:DNA-binding transcriptional MerR regulator